MILADVDNEGSRPTDDLEESGKKQNKKTKMADGGKIWSMNMQPLLRKIFQLIIN